MRKGCSLHNFTFTLQIPQNGYSTEDSGSDVSGDEEKHATSNVTEETTHSCKSTVKQIFEPMVRKMSIMCKKVKSSKF